MLSKRLRGSVLPWDLTPIVRRSVECRRERAFSREADGRGLDELHLPILFIDVKALTWKAMTRSWQ